MPDAAVYADMIADFPSETNAIFEELVSLSDKAEFDANMVRVFSARPNTKAMELDDQVGHHLMRVRLDLMNEKIRDHTLQ